MTIGEYWNAKKMTDPKYSGVRTINPRTRKGRKYLRQVLLKGSVLSFYGMSVVSSEMLGDVERSGPNDG
jgi:hypothetical protein